MYASQFYSTSDEQLKEDISTLDYIEMPEIKQFKWKETDEKSYGFIAQELEEYGLDELVSINKDGYKTVNYNAAYAIAINNANKKIKNLEDENQDLKTKVSILTDKLNMLESLVMSKLNQ